MKPITFPANFRRQLHSGVNAPAAGLLVSNALEGKRHATVWLLADDMATAERWASDLRFFLTQSGNEPHLFLFPEIDDDAEQAAASERYLDRMSVLSALLNSQQSKRTLLVVSTVAALFDVVPDSDVFKQRQMPISKGQVIAPGKLAKELVQLGYGSEAICEAPGDFALRGGLLDVYPVNADAPFRIDFFGDEIESLRLFDPTDQRTHSDLEKIDIAPAETDGMTDKKGGIVDYLPDAMTWCMLEPESLEKSNLNYYQEAEKIPDTEPNFALLFNHRKASRDHWMAYAELDTGHSIFGQKAQQWNSEALKNYRLFSHAEDLGLERVESEKRVRVDFLLRLGNWKKEGYAVTVVSSNEGEEQRLRELINEDGPRGFKPDYKIGDLSEGFYLAGENPVVYVTRNEILGTRRKTIAHLRRRKHAYRPRVDEMLNFAELADGDYLVHHMHGICIYQGVHKMMLDGVAHEVVSLEFADQAKVHLPLHESHLVSRYVGLSKTRPRLGKIGGTQWEKARGAAERATLDFAAELLSMQAQRDTEKGHAFCDDTEWQHEFESAFEYRETVDQMTAIDETKADMELSRPMDRLLCGDVGFGKTEVALRAAFKAVMDGYQVALMAPTTVLTQQLFNTFRDRVADYPIVVEMLSRFRKPRQQKRIVEQLKNGAVDIVIGTHKLLGKQVQFKNLGLLIIDEEHRFGVRHKEKLKRMRTHVDILSMSATPIPRTLYLALVGARHLSVIETPPVDRLPIETFVKNYDPDLVKRAIGKEIERGGQVFYLHNRVKTIESVATRLREWMPNLKIAVGHGQMDEAELEQIMTEFVEGRYDVLVCTTIIESGLDIPNCNTMIIEGADRFGLAQLYQLRGRIGRFKRQAYAYLFLQNDSLIPGLAGKRLSSLRQHNQLGAGFRIAMRDLELRGAGHLLGDKQSGHIAGVGFDLYCQLLRQSIARLKGESIASAIRVILRLDFVSLGEAGEALSATASERAHDGRDSGFGFGAIKDVEVESGRCSPVRAYIPSNYLSEPQLRIEFYRKLSLASSLNELKQTEEVMQDRFGPLPEPALALICCSQIRCMAEQKGLASVETEGNRLKCRIAISGKESYLKVGNRFPRLTAKSGALRLHQIISFLKRHKDTKI